MSTSSILNISKLAMENSRTAISTTADNITNINTEGYKRRRVDFTGVQQSHTSGITLNYGSVTVSRIHQQFVDAKLYDENSKLGKFYNDSFMSPQIEDAFGEPDESALNNMLNEFWDAWNDLAVDPENISYRTILVNKTENLSNTFNRVYNDLKSMQNQASEDVDIKVAEANQIINMIYEINNGIRENRSGDNNSLFDERDMLLEKLTRIMDVDIEIENEGYANIRLSGHVMVTSTYKNQLVHNTSTEDGFTTSEITFKEGGNEAVISSGELGSLISMNSSVIPDYIEKLDALAGDLAREVNLVHNRGYSTTDATGIDFFASNIANAGEFRINSAVYADPSLIATSSEPGQTGNGNIAREMADLKFEKIVDGLTVGNFYSNIITDIGNRVQESEFMYDTQEKVVLNLQNQQDSISGVSNDEEMTNLIKYQQSYQAAARLVTTSQELMAILLNMI